MNIIMLLWWSLRRGNRVVPSRWQATSGAAAAYNRLNGKSQRVGRVADGAVGAPG
jgi:hypothetical protein